MSASLVSVVTLIRRRIFGNGTSISSSNCVPRRSKVDSASMVMTLNSTPCFFAYLWLMTLVQAIKAATIVSVGVGPMFVPSRSLGSSMTALTSRTEISVREWVGQLPRMRCVTVVFSLTVTMMLLPLYRSAVRGRHMDRIFPWLEARCLIGRQYASRLAPAIDGPGVPFPHQEQCGKAAPGRPRRDPQMVADLDQPPWVE